MSEIVKYLEQQLKERDARIAELERVVKAYANLSADLYDLTAAVFGGPEHQPETHADTKDAPQGGA